jgi:hypothetical protein
MNNEYIHEVANRLFEQAAKIRFGSATLTVKLHDGRATETTISVTQNTKQKEVVK